jgi:hypothetical protein
MALAQRCMVCHEKVSHELNLSRGWSRPQRAFLFCFSIPPLLMLSAKSEMGCIQSSAMTPEDLAAANLAAMKKKEKRGKDRMGHDKNMQYVTPGSPEDNVSF